MGKINKVLAEGTLEPRSITPCGIWSDLCENIHLHYRNKRFDFSEVEWSHFRAAVNMLGVAVEKESFERDYKEGDPGYLVHLAFNTPLKSDSEYYTNRATIELQRDNTVHFHYRDFRLHLSNSEFLQIARMFSEALVVANEMKPFPHKGITEAITEMVPIDLIQPYDDGHKPGIIDDEHRKGIDHCKKLILRGASIRPILVNDEGQRMDGFKRYMAHKELGRADIHCVIDPYAKMGGQHNQGMVADD